MAVEGATWLYTQGSQGYGGPNRFGYAARGDTTIDGQVYKQVYDLSYIRQDTFFEYQVDYGSLVAGIRDDVEEQKVYVIEIGSHTGFYCQDFERDTTEYVLYDFGLVEGNLEPICDALVTGQTTYEAFGYSVEGYTVGYSNYHLQRFGHLNGIFADPDIAFIQGGGISFKGYCIGDFEDCQDLIGPLSAKEIRENDDIKISPNPAQDYINISYQAGVISNIKLYSLDGALIRELDGLNQESVNDDLQGGTTQGLIIALITDGEGRQYRKKVLVH